MIYATLRKGAGAKLDYSIDYSSWLASGVTISTSAWTTPAGITEVSESNTTTTATVILSGGTEGKVYDIVNSITLSNGLIETRTLRIIVPTPAYNAAYNELFAKVQAAVEPVLTESELNELLLDNVRASTWEASTTYSLGSIVVPTTNNKTGRRYRLIDLDGSGVTSGATEPSWPAYDYGTVTDGNLTWAEDGIETGLWDVRDAAYHGWLLKAAKASEYTDGRLSTGDANSKSQIYTHCLNMADRYVPIGVA